MSNQEDLSKLAEKTEMQEIVFETAPSVADARMAELAEEAKEATHEEISERRNEDISQADKLLAKIKGEDFNREEKQATADDWQKEAVENYKGKVLDAELVPVESTKKEVVGPTSELELTKEQADLVKELEGNVSQEKTLVMRAEAKKLQVELDDARKSYSLLEKNDPRYAEIQKDYQTKTEAMKSFVYEAKRSTLLKKGLSEVDVEKELNKYTQEILAPNFAVSEAAKMQDEKADETMLEKVKDSRMSQMIYGAVEKYRKLPFKQKILISAGLIGGAVVAGVAGGTAGALIGGGVGIAKFAQRFLGGAGTAVGLEAMMQKSQQKWMTKEGWGRNRKEYMANEIHRLRAGVREGGVNAESLEGMAGLEEVERALEERKELEDKFEKRRTILAGIGGVAVGSGAAFQAVKQFGEWTGANDMIFGLLNKVPGVETVKGLFGEAKEQVSATVAPIQERIMPVAIGVRGPEGALIDNFKAHPEMAKAFGWDGKSKLSEWAGAKAGELWNNDAKEALKNPKILAQMGKLGFSKDADGYAKMAHRIGKGFIQIDPEGKGIKFTDMEYLKNTTKELKALLETDERVVSIEEVPTAVSGNTGPTIEVYVEPKIPTEQIVQATHGTEIPTPEVAPEKVISTPHAIESPAPKINIENIVTKTEAVGGGVIETTGTTAEIMGSTGRELLSKDYMSKLKLMGGDLSFTRSMLGLENRSILAQVATYNNLLSDGKMEEAAKHLGALHKSVELADKSFGVGVIDHSKIPGMK